LRTPVRFLLPALLLAVLGTLALTPLASADLLSPESGGSPNADDVDTLYWLLFVLAVLVFLGVEGALIWCLIKFRARKGAIPAQIRGNTRLEIGWTLGAALILVVIAVITFIQLDDIRNAPESSSAGLDLQGAIGGGEEDPNADQTGTLGGTVLHDDPPEGNVPPSGRSLRIRVNGQQYLWRYTYPDGDENTLNNAFDYETMVVPTDTTVTLEITSQDVVHSWWIPKLGGKMDAVPGHTNYAWFKIPARMAGTEMRGQCAELCGRGHANMIAHVRAVTPDQWQAYIQRRKREIAAANRGAARQREAIEGGQ
jgi:cytochrome c oxidase subunit II